MCFDNGRRRDRVELICECREVRFDRDNRDRRDRDRDDRRDRNDRFKCECKECNRRRSNFGW